jgi:hypothetical protein
MPRWVSSPTTSEASVSTRIGRSEPAVRAWPSSSTAMTCRVSASSGSTVPNEVPIPEKAPWISTTGFEPVPCVS